MSRQPEPASMPGRPEDAGTRSPQVVQAEAPASGDPWMSFDSENSENQDQPLQTARAPAVDAGFPAVAIPAPVTPAWAQQAHERRRERSAWSRRRAGVLLLLAVAATVTAAVLVLPHLPEPFGPAAARAPASAGNAVVTSTPAGAEIIIDDVSRGVTPLHLVLPVGPHRLKLVSGATTRVLPLSIDPGATVSLYADLPPAGPELTGALTVTSEPPGSLVSLDGNLRGATPLTLTKVSAGPHTVVIANGKSVVSRSVPVAAGATSTVVAVFVR